MPFEQGNSLGKGRPKGSKNKLSAEVKEFYALALNENRDKFIEELNSLSGKDFCTVYVAISEFIAPKMQRVDVGGEIQKRITVEDVTPQT